MKGLKKKPSRSFMRAAAGILAFVMVLPLASCKKRTSRKQSDSKYASGKEIQESDPYFNAEINELKLPLKEDQKVMDSYVDPFAFDGGMAIVPYTIMYERSSVSTVGIFDNKGNFVRRLRDESSGEVFGAVTDSDGNTCMLAKKSDSRKEKYYAIDILDPQGEVTRSISLGEELSPSATENEGALKLSVLSDGRYAIYDYSGLLIYDREGRKCLEIRDPGRMLGTAVFSQEGRSYVTSSVYDLENGDDVQIKEVDLATGKLGQGKKINVPRSLGSITETPNGLYVTGASGCYKIDIRTGDLTLIFDWNDSDVGRSLLVSSQIIPRNDDEMYARCRSFNNATLEEKTYLVKLTRAEKNPHAGKKIIVIGGSALNTNTTFVEFIDAYNRDPQGKCRAVLKDYYDDMVTGGGKSELERKIYLDVLSGEGPDILLNFATSSVFQTDNIMVDMNQYIDGKDGLDRNKYFDNVFRAMEKNGELYHIPIRIGLSGFEVNTRYISNKNGWTFDEFDQTASGMPDDVSFVESKKYNDFLKLLLDTSMDDFIDYEKKKVDFQNEEMKEFLHMAKRYGVNEIPKDEGYTYDYESNGTFYGSVFLTDEKFDKELLAAKEIFLIQVSDYFTAKNKINGRTDFLGYPSSDRSGMTIQSLTSIGIVATSDYQDLAWDLIRSYMEYSEANTLGDMGSSVNKEVFENEARYVLTLNQEEYDRAVEEIEELKKQYGGDNMIIEGDALPALMTEKDVEEFRTLIMNATKSSCIDEAIFNIIAEEAAGYFAGDRTEEDVLKNIENRAATVVKEM